MKKVLSVVLAVLMMFSMMSAAFAANEQQPVVNVNLIKGTAFADTEGFEDFPFEGKDLDYLVGAVFSVDQLGSQSFEDFLVDFKLSVGADMEAEFYGKYGTGTEYNKWMQPGEYNGEADGFIEIPEGAHHLFEEYGVKNLLTIEKVLNIETFYCALYVKPESVDAPVDISLGLDMYEKPEEGQDPVYEEVEVSEESVQEIKVAMERPTAVIKMVEGRDFATTPGFEDFAEKCGIDNIDMNYVIGAYIDVEDVGTGYDDYFVDFILNFSDDAKGRYFGKYTGNFSTGTVTYDWSYDSVPADITAGATSILSALNYAGSKMTVKDACTCVSGGFYSALYVDPSSVSAPITVSMDAAVYQEPEQGKPVVTEVVKASADSVKEAEVAFTKPVANITMVDGKDFANTEVFKDFPLDGVNTDYLVGAIVKVADRGEGFDKYLVDFNINLSSAVKAKFYGTYSYNQTAITYPWQTASNEYADIPAGGYNLLDSSNPLGIKINVAEAAEEIGTFYCALLIDPNSVNDVVTATLNTVVFEAPAEGKEPEFITVATDDASNNTIETCTVNPVANITMVDGKDFATTEGFEDFVADYAKDNNGEELNMGNVIGAVLKVNKGGQGFEDYMVDFKLNLSEAVDAKFYGKYNYRGESTGWMGTTDYQPVPAGDSYLLDSTGDSFDEAKLSVAEVVKDVDTFYCAFVIDPDTADDVVKAKLDVVICEKGKDVKTEAIVVENDNNSDNEAVACRVAPTAEIKMVKGVDFATTDGFEEFAEKCGVENIDMNYVVGAYIDIAALGTGYEDNFIDFILNLDAPVEAMFFGKYTAEFGGETKVYDWTSTGTFSPINAGSTNILSGINYPGSQMTLQEAYDCVDGGFYCAFYVKPDSVSAPVTVSLTPAVYKDAADERIMAESTDESVLTAEVAPVEPVVPTVNITMIEGKNFCNNPEFADFATAYGDDIDMNNVVGAVLKVKDAGIGYNDYMVDFKLNLSEDVEAKFYGKYNYRGESTGWQGTSDFTTVPAGDSYLLNAPDNTFTDANLTVAEVVKEVDTFYCVLVVDPDSAEDIVTASIDVVAYEKETDVKVTGVELIKDEDSDNSAEVCSTSPVVDVKLIPGREFSKNIEFKDFAKKSGITDLDMDCVLGAEITLISKGEGFDDALVDFALGLSEDVDAKLYGKFYYNDYDFYDWTSLTENFENVSAEGMYVLRSASDGKFLMNVAEVDEMVGTFYCVLVVDPDSASDVVDVTLNAVTYNEPAAGENPVYTVVDTTDASVTSAEVCRIRPVAEIEMIDGVDFADNDVFDDFDFTGVDPESVVGAKIKITDMGKFFDDSLVDFRLNLSDDVEAKVYGSYIFNEGKANEQAFAWTSLTGDEYAQFKAGDNYVLDFDTELNIEDLTLAEVKENVGTFYCVFVINPSPVSTAYEAINTTLDIVVYDEPADGEEVEYIAADCNNDNKATVFSGFDVIIDDQLDVVDYQAVVNIALGAEEGYEEDVVKRADVDGDGFVDVLDAVLVERRYER